MKHLRSKLFTVIIVVMIAAQALAACAPATTPTKEPTQPHEPDPTATSTPAPEPTATESAAKIDPVAFRQAMRDLWEDHTAWTRLYIVSAAADLPQAGMVAERLLQNQTDIGNAVAGFYGEEAGAALTELLRGHILTAADLIAAAKAGDQDAVAAASDAWYANADEISAFLAGANPAWPEDALQHMMDMHLDQTLEEATAELTGDYATSIAKYDEIITHIQEMADTLSAGIITQFPDMFGEPSLPKDQEALYTAMRDLWVDHTYWTREYIVSAAADLPQAGMVAERLLQNQTDIGNAVAGFYGDEAGAALTELLRGHILTAADIITAAKAGDQDAVNAANEAWYANADEISAFLAGANPAWPEDALQHMMDMHLDQTLTEATSQLTGDYPASIASYDEIVTHIQQMADTLSAGIITQFPDKFK